MGGNGPGRERYTLLPVSYKKITGIDFGSFSVFYEQHTQVGPMTEEQEAGMMVVNRTTSTNFSQM